MDFIPVFIKMSELFLIIIIGYIAAKVKILGPNVKAALSKVIINISMPCTILSSVMNSENLPSRSEIAFILLIAFSTYIVLFLLAKGTSFILRLKGREKGAAEFGIMFSNVAFIGFPVTNAVLGSESAFYTSIFNMPFSVLCYSLGIAMLSGYSIKEKMKSVSETEESTFRFFIGRIGKLILTPAMIAAILCIIMGVSGFQGPDFLADTFDILGGITTPGALLVIGAALAEMPFKEMFTNVKAYLFAIIQVIVTPLVMYFLYLPVCGDNAMLLGETVIISAMPVATAGTMLCVEYGGDEKFMAQITFITTLATVITIPLLAVVL